MATLIQNANIYAPEHLGKKDILICGNKIEAISEPGKIQIEGIDLITIDASDRVAVPGIIDSHVHILGGGGEGGPATRAPEIKIEDILQSGVSTVIGCLGTDGTTRHMESLLAKARGLEDEGISAFIFSGSYQIPVVTITGSVCSDLVLIEKVIGAGEIAISDHRSSQPTFEEIARLAAECRVGGMLGRKAGVLHLHLGNGPGRLEMLFKLMEKTEIPSTQVIPTHVNRNPQLLEEAIAFVNQGGYIDLTAGSNPESEDEDEISIATAIQLCKEKKAPLTHITVSSDGNGSLPIFDKKGTLKGLTISTQESLLKNFKHMIKNNLLSLEEGLRLLSTNPAHFYKLDHKGKVQVGKDADLLLLDDDYNITDFFVLGRQMIAQGDLIAKGTFSPPHRA
jgi:beta-aspartyl-dipeptidase (metallo-type)